MELGSRKLLLHYGRVVMLLKKRFGKVLALGLYFLFLTLWSSSVSGAERREHGNLLFRWFKSQEYKGSEQNWAIVQDQRGLLYVGNNEGGVLEYDGERWRRIAVTENRIVRSLSVGESGVVYVGLVGDFGRLLPDKNGKLTYHSLTSLLGENMPSFSDVYKTYTIGNTVYFCTTSYLFAYNESERKLQTFRFPTVHAFLSFQWDDEVAVSTFSDTVFRFAGRDFSPLVMRFSEEIPERQIYGMIPLGTDSVLLATNKCTFYILSRNTGQVDALPQNWGGVVIQRLREEEAVPYSLRLCPNGNIGVGFIFSEDIAYVELNRKGGVVYTAGVSSGLADPFAMDHLHTTDGSLWLSQNNGITKIEQQSAIRKFDETNGVSGAVLDVQRFDGALYIGTMSGVQRLEYREGVWQFVSLAGANQPVWDLHPYYDPISGRRILLGLGMNTLYSIKDNRVSVFSYSDHDQQFGGFVLCDTRDDARTLYVGTPSGVVRLYQKDNGTWTRTQLFQNEINDEVRSLVCDFDNNLWIGTLTNGVYVLKLRGGEASDLRHIDEHCGLPTMVNNEVFFLNEKTYIGTEHGLMAYDWQRDTLLRVDADSKPQYLSRVAGMRNRVVAQRLNAETQEYYIAMSLLDAKGNLSGEDTKPYARLPHQWCDKIYWDDDKSIWFTYGASLYNFDLSQNRDYEHPFRSFVRKVHAIRADSILFGGTHYTLIDSVYRVLTEQTEERELHLPYRENSIAFEVGTDFFEGEGMLYSYRLRNSGDDWTKWEAQPEIRYMNISPGSYEFQVRARNLYGVESNIASYRFTVDPPFYRTIWAYIFYFILLCLLVWGIVVLNTRRVLAEKKRLQILVNERTAEVVAQKERIEGQNKEILNSINYASKIQRAVLPTMETVRELFNDSFLLFFPRDVVSGDFYWMRELNGKKICAIADCTGHGVPGGFMSMLGATFLHQVVDSLDEVHTDEVLNRLRAAVIESLKQTDQIGSNKDGMDIALYILDEKNRKLEFSGANNPLIIIRKGEVIQYKADKMPIAIYLKGETPFSRVEVDLEPGDVLYTFSDGYVDQFGGPQNRKFMIKNFKELLAKIAEKDMAEQYDILSKTLLEWQGQGSRTDDVIVFGLRIH